MGTTELIEDIQSKVDELRQYPLSIAATTALIVLAGKLLEEQGKGE